LTLSNIDIVRLCHAPSLASTQAARHARPVTSEPATGAEPALRARAQAHLARVIGTFVLGWLLGVAVVFKLWQLAHAPRWLIFSGMGMVSFLMAPLLGGAFFSRAVGRLAARGWRGAPLGLVELGICGLVVGLLAL
jgi:hypothetical protein